MDREDTTVLFSPPLWSQRLDKLRTTIFDLDIQEVCDLGCGEGRLLEQLKTARCTTLLLGVDIDKTALKEAWERCAADFQDYHFLRPRQSVLKLYYGSILCPSPALPFQPHCVTFSEVIEHLYPSEVPIATAHIFHFLNPKYVIVTTPNADFNVVFGRSGFRHLDHKFEWTRKEFSTWVEDVCIKYGYRILELTGVGERPGMDIGFCTQIAVFQRLISRKRYSREDAPDTYTLFQSIEFPTAAEEHFSYSFCTAVLYHSFSARRRPSIDDTLPLPLADVFDGSCELQGMSDGQYAQFLHLMSTFLARIVELAKGELVCDLRAETISFPVDCNCD